MPTPDQVAGRLSPEHARGGRDDGLVTVAPLRERLGDVTALIDTEPEEAALAHLRAGEATGRPLGSDDFVTRLEELCSDAYDRRSKDEKPTPGKRR